MSVLEAVQIINIMTALIDKATAMGQTEISKAELDAAFASEDAAIERLRALVSKDQA